MFELVIKLVQQITLKKVLLFALTCIIGVFFFTIFERRSEIFASTPDGLVSTAGKTAAPFMIGSKSRSAIKEIVDLDKTILGAAAFSVNLRLNVRTTLFYYDEKIGDAADNPSVMMARFPFLTHNEENNRVMVRLINGEFNCAPFSPRGSQSSAIEGNPAYISACRSSLPPYYGNFTGYIVFYLKNEPTLDELIKLKSQMELLATDIYLRDVLPAYQ